jgi:adenosylcobinamide-GDP ribazoletransferase
MSYGGPLRAAVALLTRLPVGNHPITAADRAQAPVYFPLVGLALGTMTYGLLTLPSGLASPVVVILVVTAQLWVTGAFHEDGLADTIDALGGSRSRQQVFTIMKDSRIGTYGAAALLGTLALRCTLFVELLPSGPLPFLLYGSLARLAPVWLMSRFEHASPETSKQHEAPMCLPWSQALMSTLLTLCFAGLSIVIAPALARNLGLSLVGLVAVFALMSRIARRLGGITGDLLGAAEQLSEVAVLVAFSWQK